MGMETQTQTGRAEEGLAELAQLSVGWTYCSGAFRTIHCGIPPTRILLQAVKLYYFAVHSMPLRRNRKRSPHAASARDAASVAEQRQPRYQLTPKQGSGCSPASCSGNLSPFIPCRRRTRSAILAIACYWSVKSPDCRSRLS